MKKENILFEFKIELYRKSIIVLYGEDFNLIEQHLLKKKNHNKKDIKELIDLISKNHENYEGLCQPMISGNQIIILKHDCNLYHVIPHEALHATLDILRCVGITPINEYNEEALAYLLGYVTEKIFKNILK